VKLLLDLTAEDMRRLRRTAQARPTGGYSDLAAAVLAATRLREDGSARAELTSFTHVWRFCRQAWTGDGGYQQQLRRLAVMLDTDDGEQLTTWPEIRAAVDAAARPHRVEQLSFFNTTTTAA
jgi:hypothetical protein